MESTPNEINEDDRHYWVELRSEKQWSRLLYPNPVCFLTTIANMRDDKSTVDDGPVRDDFASACDNSHEFLADSSSSRRREDLGRNVMVLSWLTATNNQGGLAFSIHTRRYSARLLLLQKPHPHFVLSVPTRDFQQLVLQAGSVTGAWGVSKLENDHYDDRNHQEHLCCQDPPRVSSDAGLKHTGANDNPRPSEKNPIGTINKKRKKSGPRFPRGIPGLRAVSLGSDTPLRAEQLDTDPSLLFAIQGTVAHLQCRVTNMYTNDGERDADHRLVLAQVERAWVRDDYWNKDKNLFIPLTETTSPYLTFLGSQTFGYVVPQL
jgi:flavin reductase (DIM6/NTAB) family NADH-FMN oxidoreductase RutF